MGRSQKCRKPRKQNSSASSSSTSSATAPKPPCPTEVHDMFASTDNKLKRLDTRVALIEVLHKEFQNLRNSLEHSQQEMDSLAQENKSLHQSVSSMSAQLCSVTNQLASVTAQNKIMKDTTPDLQSRSMRDTLIFPDIHEPPGTTTDQPEAAVRDFMIKQLQLPLETVSNITFHHTHRLGQKRTNPTQPRPIIVKFEHFEHKELVQRQGQWLKGTDYGLNNQYPAELSNRRKQLFYIRNQMMKEVMDYDSSARGPLKRTRKRSTEQPPAVVSASRDLESSIENGESPTKKRRLEAKGDMASGGHNDMDVQKSEAMEINDNLEMDAVDDCSRQPAIQRPHIDENFLPHEHYQPHVNEDVQENVLAEGHVASTKPPAQLKAPQKRPDITVLKISIKQDYRREVEAKAKAMNSDISTGNRQFPVTEKTITTQQHINNILLDDEHIQHQKTEESKNAVIKERSEKSCRGWCSWRWIFTGLLICISSLLALRFIHGRPPRAVKLEAFADQLTLLQTQFPSQRPELWKRSRIHLEKHLKTAQPTEPVSLIFTAGFGAERTLRCLAQGLAASFSSALNASVLYFDGAGTAGKDSDQVKLDIDTQLRAAFEGDKPAAVIHRLEELPPGSTLIFYRYCHHKYAAYKRALLLFTVVLPQEEVGDEQSLIEVEERVQDYLREKLVDSNNQVGFNEIDRDKFGGLWSHISHLILPVVWEEIKKGC